MSIDVDASYVTEDSNVETVEEVCCPEEEFDSRLLSGNLTNLRFPLKLWRIVTDCRSGAIQWIHHGKAIAINYHIFEREYLDASKRLFKTNNITSFVRQLNLYGFRKVPKNSKNGVQLEVSLLPASNHSVFHHESFRSDRPDLLLHVNRRGIKPEGKKNRTSSRPRREPRRRTTPTSSDSETSESQSSDATEQVIEDGIVDLDQADLIIPCAVQQEIIEDDISQPSANEFVVQKSKRKSQHQVKHVESKRMRVRSESAAMNTHNHGPINRSGSLSSGCSLHQQVAEEFIRKVRSISESKDDFSNGSATNSAIDDEEEDDDEDRDGTIRLSNRQFVFDLKQLNGFSGQAVGAARERVKVERLSRNFEPAMDIKTEVKEEEEVMEEDIGEVEGYLEPEEVVEEVVEELSLPAPGYDDDDDEEDVDDETRSPPASLNKSDYFAEEHNTARALLSLTCAKLQRDVAGMKTVIEPTSLTTAGML